MIATTTHDDKELARLPIVRIQDVLLARFVAREEATRLGFAPQALTQISTAISEITRNVVQHSGGSGLVRLFEVTGSGRLGLKIAVEDSGAGIADADRALAGVSAGAGIPGSRALMDELVLRSSRGVGTSVTMIKWLPSA